MPPFKDGALAGLYNTWQDGVHFLRPVEQCRQGGGWEDEARGTGCPYL